MGKKYDMPGYSIFFRQVELRTILDAISLLEDTYEFHEQGPMKDVIQRIRKKVKPRIEEIPDELK